MRNIFYIFTIIILLPIKGFTLGSGGIGNEVVTAKTLLLGGSILVENDPGNVYLNPSLLGDQGKLNNTLGLTYYNYSAKRDGNSSQNKMETTETVSPNFFVSHSINNWGLGIGFLTPYGLETDWGQTSPVRYVATKSEIKMYDITTAGSYRFNDQLSFGMGIDYFSTFNASLEKKAPVDVLNFLIGSPTLGSADANSKLEGDGNQWGYHTGATYSPNTNHAIAVTYHSEVKTEIEGTLEITGLSGASTILFGGTNYRTEAKTDIFYPQNIQFGYRWSPNDKTSIYTNAAWYDWSANRQLELRLPNASSAQRALVGAPIPLQWRDVWSFSAAIKNQVSDHWTFGSGIFYESAVYPEQTFSPAVPDLDRYGCSIGSIYNGQKAKVEFVYEPIILRKTKINNTVGQSAAGLASADISGTYKGVVHIISLNAGVKF